MLWAVEGILGSLDKWTLTMVFLEWMRRLERCIETDGNSDGISKRKILTVIGFEW
jgi:hypothetical protein